MHCFHYKPCNKLNGSRMRRICFKPSIYISRGVPVLFLNHSLFIHAEVSKLGKYTSDSRQTYQKIVYYAEIQGITSLNNRPTLHLIVYYYYVSYIF